METFYEVHYCYNICRHHWGDDCRFYNDKIENIIECELINEKLSDKLVVVCTDGWSFSNGITYLKEDKSLREETVSQIINFLYNNADNWVQKKVIDIIKNAPGKYSDDDYSREEKEEWWMP